MSLILLDSGAVAGGAGQDLASTASGSSSVSAGLKVAHGLSTTSSGISNVVVPALTRNRGLSATANGVGTLSADLATIRLVSTPSAGVSAVSSSLRVLHTLRATSTGLSAVSASLTISSLSSISVGVGAVSASLHRDAGLRSASIDGRSDLSVSLGVFHTLESSNSHGAGTLTAAFSKRVRRTAVANLSIIAEYRRIVGILMLIDPGFQLELSTPPTAQTFTFVKKIVKGLFYVDIQVSGSTLICQVKTGDGQNYNGVVDVSIRTVTSGIVPPVISVTNGVQKASGLGACWLQTTSNGAFSVSITGSGPVLVEAFPKQGVVMSTGLSL